MAVGVLACLGETGRRLSVIGFDDMPIARDVTPPLTTVRLPLADMGARAMAMALDDQDGPARIEPAAAELIHRSSSRPLRPS
jgi:LacI family transcriptional regulator